MKKRLLKTIVETEILYFSDDNNDMIIASLSNLDNKKIICSQQHSQICDIGAADQSRGSSSMNF